MRYGGFAAIPRNGIAEPFGKYIWDGFTTGYYSDFYTRIIKNLYSIDFGGDCRSCYCFEISISVRYYENANKDRLNFLERKKNMDILAVKKLEYTYQGKYQKVTALRDITCHFEKGKFYALIGRSGSGKTTLLSLLAGLGTPTKGEILVDGTPLKKKDLERHRRENVSVIYQSFHLFPCLTVLENVMYPMQIVHEKKETARCRAAELLQSVGIKEEYYKKLPAMLSGGEQQRTAIARALASKAKFLLADEPTGNLDVENSKIIIGIFRKLVEEGYCVIVVTHDTEIAGQADVIYELVDGNLNF